MILFFKCTSSFISIIFTSLTCLISLHQLLNLLHQLKASGCLLFPHICILMHQPLSINITTPPPPPPILPPPPTSSTSPPPKLHLTRPSGLPQIVRMPLQRPRRLRLLPPGRQHEDRHKVRRTKNESNKLSQVVLS